MNAIPLMALRLMLGNSLAAETSRSPVPVVEAEETVYVYANANHGAVPLWCQGWTSLLRTGDRLFAFLGPGGAARRAGGEPKRDQPCPDPAAVIRGGT